MDTNVRIELKQNDKVFYANDFVSDSNGYVSFELDCGNPDQADNCAFNSSQKYSYSKSPSIISLKVDIQSTCILMYFDFILEIYLGCSGSR